jgi:radical SAM protein with 4Fe4S-binding SPASM domain
VVSTSSDLREIKLEVTYRCPLTCIHCSSDATPTSALEMTLEDCSRILEEAAKMDVGEVAFSGGEPLIWSALDKMVGQASAGDMQVGLYTSGNVSSVRERLEALRDAGLHRVVFSIFGASGEVHDKITRVSGSYRETRKAIAAAVDCDLRTELHFVPMSSNLNELDEIAVASQAWGVRQISVLRLVPQGRGSLIRSQLLNRLENLQLERMIQQLRSRGVKVRTGSPYNFLMLNDQPKCSSGIDRLIVGPDLRIYPCDAFKQVKAEELVGTLDLSSLKERSLAECWRDSPFLAAVRGHLNSGFVEPCASCGALPRCLSGCLAQKVIEGGVLERKPDPMCLMTQREV